MFDHQACFQQACMPALDVVVETLTIPLFRFFVFFTSLELLRLFEFQIITTPYGLLL
jgi:hypothetical protein